MKWEKATTCTLGRVLNENWSVPWQRRHINPRASWKEHMKIKSAKPHKKKWTRWLLLNAQRYLYNLANKPQYTNSANKAAFTFGGLQEFLYNINLHTYVHTHVSGGPVQGEDVTWATIPVSYYYRVVTHIPHATQRPMNRPLAAGHTS